MKAAHEMPWPPPEGVPYLVSDPMGAYTEVIEPGALEGAEEMPGDRAFRVAEDQWSADYNERRILKIAAISKT